MTSLTTADSSGYFGSYGGAILPAQLVEPIAEVRAAYAQAKDDPAFQHEFEQLLRTYVGRPSLLYFAENLTRVWGGPRIYLKREDLNHTGSHKLNHCIGEALLAKRMGKKKLIAETGAGQHGVALATAAALMGLECEIYMGAVDVAKQHPNVARMKLLGATVVSITEGRASLKEAIDSAFATYAADYADTFFGIGSAVGPDPYPSMVRDFQSVIGREAKVQILEAEGRLPDALVACVGGGSNSLGLFSAFLDEPDVDIYGVEPGGRGLDTSEHAATMTLGTPGSLHGMRTLVLQNEDGTPAPVHSIASGLDYPGVGPQHAHLRDNKRVVYTCVTDEEAMDAFRTLPRVEGIIPALESSHALAYAKKLATQLTSDEVIIVNLSGRGDKDVDYVSGLINADE